LEARTARLREASEEATRNQVDEETVKRAARAHEELTKAEERLAEARMALESDPSRAEGAITELLNAAVRQEDDVEAYLKQFGDLGDVEELQEAPTKPLLVSRKDGCADGFWLLCQALRAKLARKKNLNENNRVLTERQRT